MSKNTIIQIQNEFFQRLSAKNSWGKNEVKELYLTVSTEVMSATLSNVSDIMPPDLLEIARSVSYMDSSRVSNTVENQSNLPQSITKWWNNTINPNLMANQYNGDKVVIVDKSENNKVIFSNIDPASMISPEWIEDDKPF
jgi:hypothetical protein